MITEHVEALRKLAAEVGGLKAFEPGVREAIGNTHWTVLMQRLDEAEAALSRTAQAPVADGVREARRQAIEEVLGLLTGHELYRYRPKPFNGFIEYARATLASSDPTPATEAGGAAMLAASPLPSSSGTGWRPIETAPKDGTKILYRNRFKSIGFCHWDEGYDDDDQPCWWDNEADDEVCPVVWLPADALPAFPAAPVSHGGGRGE